MRLQANSDYDVRVIDEYDGKVRGILRRKETQHEPLNCVVLFCVDTDRSFATQLQELKLSKGIDWFDSSSVLNGESPEWGNRSGGEQRQLR